MKRSSSKILGSYSLADRNNSCVNILIKRKLFYLLINHNNIRGPNLDQKDVFSSTGPFKPGDFPLLILFNAFPSSSRISGLTKVSVSESVQLMCFQLQIQKCIYFRVKGAKYFIHMNWIYENFISW